MDSVNRQQEMCLIRFVLRSLAMPLVRSSARILNTLLYLVDISSRFFANVTCHKVLAQDSGVGGADKESARTLNLPVVPLPLVLCVTALYRSTPAFPYPPNTREGNRIPTPILVYPNESEWPSLSSYRNPNRSASAFSSQVNQHLFGVCNLVEVSTTSSYY
jgi:hypothetical protein